MEIQVYQVTKQADNSYTASLNFIEQNKIIQQKIVAASTKDEFKNQIRIFKLKIEQMEADKQNLLTIVQTAIDEIMAEG